MTTTHKSSTIPFVVYDASTQLNAAEHDTEEGTWFYEPSTWHGKPYSFGYPTEEMATHAARRWFNVVSIHINCAAPTLVFEDYGEQLKHEVVTCIYTRDEDMQLSDSDCHMLLEEARRYFDTEHTMEAMHMLGVVFY